MFRVNACFGMVLAVTAALLAGCSSLKTYPNDLPKNVRVQTQTSSGFIFQSLNVGMNIYAVARQCQPTYLGTVDLDRPVVDVGLSVRQQLYLEFTFNKSARLYSSSSSIDYGTLFRPRPSRKYVIDVSYQDDLYQVKIRRKGARSYLRRRPLETCKPK